MKSVKVYGLFLFIVAMVPGQVFAHALWKPGSITPPRDITDSKLKVGPCGGTSSTALLPRGNKPKIFKPGEKITVEWIETINHKGLFFIDYLNELNNPLKPSNVIQLPDPIDVIDRNNPKVRTQILTIPNVNCPVCTMQLIQEMWFNNDATRPPEFDVNNVRQRSNYYSCSDIRIESTNNIVPGKVTLPPQSRINNTDNVILNWVNPSELSNNINNVAYRVLILMDTKPINANPVNNIEYTTSLTGTNTIGTAKVVYVGNLETATITGLNNTDKLFFKLFTYNVSNLYSAGVSSDGVTDIPVAPVVSLKITQGIYSSTNVTQNNTNVLITANVTDGNVNDTHSYSWVSKDFNFTDNDIVDNTFTIKSSEIDALPLDSTYNIAVIVTDTGGLQGTSSVDITLKANPPPIAVDNGVINNITDNGGCTLSKSAKFDPLLLLLTLFSLIVLLFRSSKQN